MDKKIIAELGKITDLRRKAAICTVISAKGSTPRKAGSKMIVYDDGKVVGSVGGGELEFQIVKQALKIIETQKPEIFSFALKRDLQMACGGQVEVFVEPVKLPDQLVIFGAGHIGKALADIAKNLDFSVIVVDERKNIFDDWQKHESFTFLNEIYTSAIEKIIFDKQTYICSATYAHTHDKEIARLCAGLDVAYLGVIASKNKAVKIRKYLEESGISQENIEKIEMPMGIPIACETPYEIAISIMARIVDLRNKKSPF